MNILRYSILAGIMWVLPSFVLAYFNPALGSPLSYLIFALLAGYFILETNRGPLLYLFLILGVTYYVIAAFNYGGGLTTTEYILIVIKYLIVIICGGELLRKTSLKELYIFLLVGALSVILHAVFFANYNAGFTATYGRFSGFYLNPNYAGAMSLIGFALSFGIKDKKLKYIGYLIFTVGGFFTFSRYFLGMWLVFNLISVLISKRNLIIPLLGAVSLTVIFVFGSALQLNTQRFNAIQNIFSGNTSNTQALQEDSRTETWASYANVILDKPVLGNGFGKLQGKHFGLIAGVHNTYLLVIGEAGILPFLLLVYIYLFFLFKGYNCFKTEPHYSLLALALFTALLVTHNYFDKFSLLFMSMYLYLAFTEKGRTENADVQQSIL